MTSGFHSHYCPGCNKRYECPQMRGGNIFEGNYETNPRAHRTSLV